MKVIEKGHIYELDYIDDTCEKKYRHQKGKIVFVNREGQNNHPGTQTQEVLRVLIDRTMHCDNCLPHPVDSAIVHHLRMALVLHEARALIRKTEKNLIEPENILVGTDGHFHLDDQFTGSIEQTADNVDWVGRKREKRDDLPREDAAEELHGVPGEAHSTSDEPGNRKN
jgi:hypothetical protein